MWGPVLADDGVGRKWRKGGREEKVWMCSLWGGKMGREWGVGRRGRKEEVDVLREREWGGRRKGRRKE